ncbi:MAG: hypothetical protein LKE31_05265 [Bacilli bacterium]|jgi:hypothetical protein|nr:hypothetical protein [Bacilli bacterium]
MNEPTVSRLKRILSPLKRSPKKFVSLDMLSRMVGLYSDVIADELEYFEPLIRMDSSLNMKDLIPSIESYIEKSEVKKEKVIRPKRVVVAKKEIDQYPSIAEFIYAKMTSAGGLMDPSYRLSDHDLHLLQKLVIREINARNKAAKKKK